MCEGSCQYSTVGGYFVTQMLLRGNGSARPVDKYTYLENDIDRSNRQFIDDTNVQQQVRDSSTRVHLVP